ncbi:cupin domain-containing protein [Halobacillus mangrovi]|uniref:cupin domain-containing protein n=1 Tax=Halobacillus mangrovi TaxID=402384 RepID=UPI003D99EEC4
MQEEAEKIINKLDLQPHPEGGFYKQTYSSDEKAGDETLLKKYKGERLYYTSIYFLLRSQDVSHLHRLKSDELWYFHSGSPLTIHMIHPEGTYEEVKLGLDLDNGEVPQYKVPKHTIFGSSVNKQDTFSLVSCMVSPGFDFDDFELLSKEELLEQYPEHRKVINTLASH